MRTEKKSRLAVVALLILSVLTLSGRWYRSHQPRPTAIIPQPSSAAPVVK